MDWVSGILTKINEGFQSSVSALNDLLTSINNATDSLQNIMTADWIKYIQAFHYVVGSEIYYAFYTMILLGLGIMVFNLIIIIKNQFAFGGGLINAIKGIFIK